MLCARASVCVPSMINSEGGRERERERERACYWRAWWLLVPGQRQLDDSTDWRYRSRTESITRRMLSLPLKEKPIVANRIDGTRFSLSLSLSLFFILPFLTSSPSVREFSFIRITVLGRDWIFTALLYRPSLFRAVPSFFFSMIILSIMVWFGFFFCPFIISSYLPLSVFRMSHRTLELLFPIALSFMPKKRKEKKFFSSLLSWAIAVFFPSLFILIVDWIQLWIQDCCHRIPLKSNLSTGAPCGPPNREADGNRIDWDRWLPSMLT